ncbi:hypothetical protein Aperf_G00000082004 [Anoplocephala perfoliata]
MARLPRKSSGWLKISREKMLKSLSEGNVGSIEHDSSGQRFKRKRGRPLKRRCNLSTSSDNNLTKTIPGQDENREGYLENTWGSGSYLHPIRFNQTLDPLVEYNSTIEPEKTVLGYNYIPTGSTAMSNYCSCCQFCSHIGAASRRDLDIPAPTSLPLQDCLEHDQSKSAFVPLQNALMQATSPSISTALLQTPHGTICGPLQQVQSLTYSTPSSPAFYPSNGLSSAQLLQNLIENLKSVFGGNQANSEPKFREHFQSPPFGMPCESCPSRSSIISNSSDNVAFLRALYPEVDVAINGLISQGYGLPQEWTKETVAAFFSRLQIGCPDLSDVIRANVD